VRLFVTGLGGYLGRALAAAGGEVAGTVRNSAAPAGADAFRIDVRDEDALAAAMREFRADAVVHTAYLQAGSEMESVNVDGSAAAARAARRCGVRLVHLSSDAIFSGADGRPLSDAEPPTPVTPYGKAKAAAEAAVAGACPDALIVRTSLIYGGAEPSNHETSAFDPAQSFYIDEVRCPIQVDDLASALVELAALDVSGPLNVAGADAVSRLEFARLVVTAGGGDPRLVRGAPRPSARPGEVILDCSRARSLVNTELRGVREVLERANT
jgi:dTDP-4-dehydrorhamnose reductase